MKSGHVGKVEVHVCGLWKRLREDTLSLTLLKSGLSWASITVMLDCLCRRQKDRTSEHQAASCFCRGPRSGCNLPGEADGAQN